MTSQRSPLLRETHSKIMRRAGFELLSAMDGKIMELPPNNHKAPDVAGRRTFFYFTQRLYVVPELATNSCAGCYGSGQDRCRSLPPCKTSIFIPEERVHEYIAQRITLSDLRDV